MSRDNIEKLEPHYIRSSLTLCHSQVKKLTCIMPQVTRTHLTVLLKSSKHPSSPSKIVTGKLKLYCVWPRSVFFSHSQRNICVALYASVTTTIPFSLSHSLPLSLHLPLSICRILSLLTPLLPSHLPRYVTGEFRWRHGYSRHNPRKMVRMWAEKEMRNLIRLETAGIPGTQL